MTVFRQVVFGALLASVAACTSAEVADEETKIVAEVEDAATIAPPLAAEMPVAASSWLDLLDGDQRARANVAFSAEARKDWHYVPRERAGVTYGEMTEAQRGAARALLETGLSHRGIEQVEAIIALETVLRDLGGDPVVRDPENYAFLIFGEPGVYPWGWRIEGHHLSINFNLMSAQDVSVTPTFLGSNPGRYPQGELEGTWVQDAEFTLALALAQSLTDAQWQQAHIGDDPFGEIQATPGKAARDVAGPAGLSATDLSEPQQARLKALIAAYVGVVSSDLGAPYTALIEAEWDALHFAWAGGREAGDPFYYRVQGPRVLIEYDNSRDGGNHVHAVWRDPKNDFGEDALRQHLNDAH